MTADVIASKLRTLRGDKSREEVSKATNITVSALTNYECGIRVPRDDIKKTLADFYGVSVDELFYSP